MLPLLSYACFMEVVHHPNIILNLCGQELLTKLTLMASIVTDMFVGRERFATVLLIRLTEAVILWLSDDQNFWEEIEGEAQPLGPLGLQQVNFSA